MKGPVSLPITLAVVLVATACTSAAPPSTPSSLPVTSVSPEATTPPPWQTADIVQPSEVLDPPSLSTGYQCHPCHYLAENQFLGVSSWPDGFLAVGVQQPPAQAIVMESVDGRQWQAVPAFEGAETTTAIASASIGRRTVVVGLQHKGATAWAFDGTKWQQAPDQPALLVDYAAGGMTSVTGYQGGFVAGGYRDDPLHHTASAAAWRSTDGLTWQLDEAGSVFAGGRIWGVAASTDVIVAVGTGGDPVYGPAAAWRWTAAGGWQRAQLLPDDGGAMAAVVATGHGFVAVGKNASDTGARVWTSSDGASWTAVGDQPAFDYYQLSLRMQAVTASPGGALLAGGWRSDAGKGSAETWTSADGVTWTGPVWEASFSGGQITGVAERDGIAVAVGRTGYPDWNQASAWLSDAP